MMQPVVQPVVQRVASCIRGLTGLPLELVGYITIVLGSFVVTCNGHLPYCVRLYVMFGTLLFLFLLF